MNTTIGETLNDCEPYVRDGIRFLFHKHKNLYNILKDEVDGLLYCKLALRVIMKREVELGNAKFNYETWRMEYRSWEEIRKDYGGTAMMPY